MMLQGVTREHSVLGKIRENISEEVTFKERTYQKLTRLVGLEWEKAQGPMYAQVKGLR